MIRLAPALIALTLSVPAGAVEPQGLHAALDRLADEGKFSGAVVVRGAQGVVFARGYGLADPFADRAFTPDTPVDSGSLAKPVTAAAVLMLARDGKLELDAPVRRYLPEYPHASATVRNLLAHSAGLPFDNAPEALAGKTNAALLAGVQGGVPLFAPGSGFTYCNLCHVALALLAERVSGRHYIDFARSRLALPRAVSLRPQRLAEWKGRAIGYRRAAGAPARLERFDSWEGEAFYGPANLSISARQLARWGAEWWQPRLAPIRVIATRPATIAGRTSGLTWGNWYCATDGRRCHYLGHHEGFHHMLYWDADRRVSVAMVSNNTLAPALHQRLQRALVAFADGRAPAARRELAAPLPDGAVIPGRYRFPTGETVAVKAKQNAPMTVERRGLDYPAYPVGTGIRYVPGLDVYLAGGPGGRLNWLSLYENFQGAPLARRR